MIHLRWAHIAPRRWAFGPQRNTITRPRRSEQRCTQHRFMRLCVARVFCQDRRMPANIAKLPEATWRRRIPGTNCGCSPSSIRSLASRLGRLKSWIQNTWYGVSAAYFCESICAAELDVTGAVACPVACNDLSWLSIIHCALSASSVKLRSSLWYSRTSFGPFAVLSNLEYSIALARYWSAVNIGEPFNKRNSSG